MKRLISAALAMAALWSAEAYGQIRPQQIVGGVVQPGDACGGELGGTFPNCTLLDASIDHGLIGGLGDDDHAQYLLSAGRAGGQTLTGGTGPGETLELYSRAGGTLFEFTDGGAIFGGEVVLTTGSTIDADTLDTLDSLAFALLAGRAGGQTLIGGTGTGDDLILQSTSHATKGDIAVPANEWFRLGGAGGPFAARYNSTSGHIEIETPDLGNGKFIRWNLGDPDNPAESDGIQFHDRGTDKGRIDGNGVLSNWNGLYIKDGGPISLGTSNDFQCIHNGVNTTCTSATGDLIFDNTDTNDSTEWYMGTDTSATWWRINNNSGASLFVVNGAGTMILGSADTHSVQVEGDLVDGDGDTCTVSQTLVSDGTDTDCVDIATQAELDALASAPFDDGTAIVKGSLDATKLLRFEVDGFTTGTTRVLTAPNFDGTIATLAGTETFLNKSFTTPGITNDQVFSTGQLGRSADRLQFRRSDGTTNILDSVADIGTTVQAFDAALNEIAGLTLTEGDILYVNATGNLVQLDRGADGEVLTLASGIPAWSAAGSAPQDPLIIWSNQETSAAVRTISTAIGTANLAVYMPVHVHQTTTIRRIAVWNGATVNGNFDVGIYQTDGTRLVSSGATAQSGGNVAQLVDIADTELAPGNYYVALATSSGTATFMTWHDAGDGTIISLAAGIKIQTSAMPLPASATFADPSTSNTYFPVLSMLQES